MVVGFLSLPAELICHILFLLSPTDICHFVTTCKTVRDTARNSVHVQYKLELYAQGFTEIATQIPINFSTEIRSLKKLASLWRSDFSVKTVFEEAIDTTHGGHLRRTRIQSVKCGVWWMWANGDLYIRDCNASVELSRTWPRQGLSTQHQSLRSVIVDPLQDLVITLSLRNSFMVTDAGQDHQVFLVEFRLASSQLPFPDAALASLECKHAFDAPGYYFAFPQDQPAICGDRVVVFYHIGGARDLFIQVIDWRKGYAKSYALREPSQNASFHLVDERTIVVIDRDGLLSLYTLREPDGSPQRRITYLLPGLRYYDSLPYYVIHATPSFHGTTAHPNLMPDYVPSLESQVMVIEVLSDVWPVILVIDMVIFSEQAIHSETHVEIPWSDWGPKYTCCFSHHPSHRISVFGSKIAYALPRYCTPPPGERVEGFSNEDDCFFVHIWDFNKRFIARAKNAHRRNSPGPFVRRPGRPATSCLVGDVVSNRPYTATVCRKPFDKYKFDRLFLEQDQFILTWSRALSNDIQVVRPVVDTELAD